MSPLKSVTLCNFRSHANLTVPLDSLTFIVADNNVGKTNVLRAIRWCALNEGSYAEVVKQGEDKVLVQCDFEDGVVITRFASKTTNGYILVTPDGKHTEFNKVGNSVPTEIQRIFRLSGLQQWNPHFQGVDDPAPTHLAPTVLASIFGETVGTAWVEERQKELAREGRTTEAALTEAQRALSEAQMTLLSYPDPQEVIRLKETIQESQQKLTAFTSLRSRVENLAARGRIVERLRAFAPVAPQVEALLAQAEQSEEAIHQMKVCRMKLLMLAEQQAQAHRKKIENTQVVVALDAELASLPLCPTCGQPIDRSHDHDTTG